MSIGERIKEARELRNVTQVELAEAVGTTKQNIYKYENGIVSNIPSDKIEAISLYLRISPAYLMGWTDKISVVDAIDQESAQTEGQKETPSAESERWDRFKAQYEELSAEEQHRIDAVLDALLPEAGQDQ